MTTSPSHCRRLARDESPHARIAGTRRVNTSLWNRVRWRAKAIVGDYNGDHLDDIALTGVSGWGSIPVALSLGNGSFNVLNAPSADFPVYAAQSHATPLAGYKATP